MLESLEEQEVKGFNRGTHSKMETMQTAESERYVQCSELLMEKGHSTLSEGSTEEDWYVGSSLLLYNSKVFFSNSCVYSSVLTYHQKSPRCHRVVIKEDVVLLNC